MRAFEPDWRRLSPALAPTRLSVGRAGVSLPAISSFGGFPTPAAGVSGIVVSGRHLKTFTEGDTDRAVS